MTAESERQALNNPDKLTNDSVFNWGDCTLPFSGLLSLDGPSQLGQNTLRCDGYVELHRKQVAQATSDDSYRGHSAAHEMGGEEGPCGLETARRLMGSSSITSSTNEHPNVPVPLLGLPNLTYLSNTGFYPSLDILGQDSDFKESGAMGSSNDSDQTLHNTEYSLVVQPNLGSAATSTLNAPEARESSITPLELRSGHVAVFDQSCDGSIDAFVDFSEADDQGVEHGGNV